MSLCRPGVSLAEVGVSSNGTRVEKDVQGVERKVAKVKRAPEEITSQLWRWAQHLSSTVTAAGAESSATSGISASATIALPR